jgi:predicted nucleic acid-binding protein
MTLVGATRVVVDSSAVVALLADAGPAGQWVEAATASAALFAPHLLPFEVANILGRHTLAGLLDASAATLAHADMAALPIDLYPYEVFADRAWELRANITIYDAAYVALAELLAAPLVTLDERLARAPGSRCRIVSYNGPR